MTISENDQDYSLSQLIVKFGTEQIYCSFPIVNIKNVGMLAWWQICLAVYDGGTKNEREKGSRISSSQINISAPEEIYLY